MTKLVWEKRKGDLYYGHLKGNSRDIIATIIPRYNMYQICLWEKDYVDVDSDYVNQGSYGYDMRRPYDADRRRSGIIGEASSVVEAKFYVEEVINNRNKNIEIWVCRDWETQGIRRILSYWVLSHGSKIYHTMEAVGDYAYRGYECEPTQKAAIKAVKADIRRQTRELRQEIRKAEKRIAHLDAIDVTKLVKVIL